MFKFWFRYIKFLKNDDLLINLNFKVKKVGSVFKTEVCMTTITAQHFLNGTKTIKHSTL